MPANVIPDIEPNCLLAQLVSLVAALGALLMCEQQTLHAQRSRMRWMVLKELLSRFNPLSVVFCLVELQDFPAQATKGGEAQVRSLSSVTRFRVRSRQLSRRVTIATETFTH